MKNLLRIWYAMPRQDQNDILLAIASLAIFTILVTTLL